jgi:hypothetical protein
VLFYDADHPSSVSLIKYATQDSKPSPRCFLVAGDGFLLRMQRKRADKSYSGLTFKR